MSGRPLVTVAIPLYRSLRFVDSIAANVANLEREDVEIVVSDRHGLDDAVDRLRERLAGDRRVTFRQDHDGCGWIDHYNHLLLASDAPFFMWMPHDDRFPRGYVTALVETLHEDPEAVLAFGRMDARSEDGSPVRFSSGAQATGERAGDPVERAVAFLASVDQGVPFRGVFRRDRVVAAGLTLSSSCPLGDVSWLFALQFLGSFRFTESTDCIKVFHGPSVTQRLRSWATIGGCANAMRSFADAYVPDPGARARLATAIRSWQRREGPHFYAGQLARMLRVSARWRRRVRKFFDRVLHGDS
ncbi:MAG TPA: glycosyltransferase [Thermoanaerobaculia bacterium]|nr:glycosyltransferase [Thermoanaerobaculia bacterium]